MPSLSLLRTPLVVDTVSLNSEINRHKIGELTLRAYHLFIAFPLFELHRSKLQQ
jgi:hypothetical protein